MKKFTLKELAELTQSELVGSPDHVIQHVADLESATSEDISFLANPRYETAMMASQAGAVIVAGGMPLPLNRNFLINSRPSEAFQQIVKAFHGNRMMRSSFEGIHPTAIIHPTASIGENTTIGPYAVIDNDVSVGAGTTIGAGCYIGPKASIGEDCFIHPRVTVRECCRLGDRVIIQPGAVIGSCGFGYIQDKQGRHTKLEQLGYVEIEDDVEIGANTTIDRARFKRTKIGRGTKIDNLVQIAHGVEIGEHSLVIAQTGIAGSTSIGNHVILAGQVAVSGHLKIADGVMVAGCSGISKSIQKPGKYGGIPAVPLSDYNRNAVQLRNMNAYVEKLSSLEGRLNELLSNKE